MLTKKLNLGFTGNSLLWQELTPLTWSLLSIQNRHLVWRVLRNKTANIYFYDMPMAKPSATFYFRIRLYRDQEIVLGPGRIALLEAIDETGSISAAARHLGMSYRRAWSLVNSTNQLLKKPVVRSAEGGAQGGGSSLTPIGKEAIKLYRQAEAYAAYAAQEPLKQLQALVRTESSQETTSN